MNMKWYNIVWTGGSEDQAILRIQSTSFEHAVAFAETLDLGRGWYWVEEVDEDADS